jgi:glycosyltransferase involved in cell wall biosynthesis
MKIILAVNTLGSFVSHRRGLYLKLRETNEVKVILPNSEDHVAALREIPQSSLLSLPMTRKGTNPWSELRAILGYFRLYREQRPELVHHFTIKPVIYGTLAARLAGVPVIVNSITGLGYVFTSTTLKARVLGVLVKLLYRLCFASSRVRVIFQNVDDRDFFVDHGILKKSRCFLVQGSGVDVHRFTPNTGNPANPANHLQVTTTTALPKTIPQNTPETTPNITQNTAPDNIPKIFLASRLLIEKGIFEFMAAVQILKQKKLNFEVVIAGDIDPGNPGSVSRAQVDEWRKLNLATFLGFRTDMVEILQSVDIACLPSYREGLPMALLEAMAAGKPVVTTDAPGCRATVGFVEPGPGVTVETLAGHPSGLVGTNGILVAVKDSVTLAAALEKLILEPSVRLSMGRESRKRAVDLFSTEKITSEIIKIYGRASIERL